MLLCKKSLISLYIMLGSSSVVKHLSFPMQGSGFDSHTGKREKNKKEEEKFCLKRKNPQ
jgi:hypothetical protein